SEILQERRAHLRADLYARRVGGMVHAHGEARAAPERRAHRLVELEPQEVDRRGLLLGLALEVLVGDGVHRRMAIDADPHLALDALQLSEHALALLRVRILDHHGRLPVAPVRNERVVGVELALDALLFEDALDPQHLLHLVADGELVLELQRDVGPQPDGAILLVRNDARSERVALPGVRFKGKQALSANHVSVSTCAALARSVAPARQPIQWILAMRPIAAGYSTVEAASVDALRSSRRLARAARRSACR